MIDSKAEGKYTAKEMVMEISIHNDDLAMAIEQIIREASIKSKCPCAYYIKKDGDPDCGRCGGSGFYYRNNGVREAIADLVKTL